MALNPLDPKVWWSVSILPITFVAALVATRRNIPLSDASYVLITVWLTLHTIAAHYTYPKVPGDCDLCVGLLTVLRKLHEPDREAVQAALFDPAAFEASSVAEGPDGEAALRSL